MTALLIVLAAVATYGYGARRYALAWAIAETERNIESYPSIGKDPGQCARWRRGNLALGWGPGLIWPIALLARHLGDAAFERMPLSSVEQQAQIKARDRKIAQLERELGLPAAASSSERP